RTNLVIYAVFHDEALAAAAREKLQLTGLYGLRITVRHQPAKTAIPYPSFFADLIVSEAAAASGKLPDDPADMNRMLKPIRGVAMIGGKPSAASLRQWAENTKLPGWQIVNDGGLWAKLNRPRLKDAGGWTHQYADAGNSASSHDAVLKPPLGVVWYGAPLEKDMVNRTGVASLILEGVLVAPGANSIEGYDAYTGRWLWRREMRHLSRTNPYGGCGNLAANSNNLFIAYGHQCLRLDLMTGKTVQKYPGAWGWIACDEKLLYGSDGNPYISTALFAMDIESGKRLWTFSFPAKDKNKLRFQNNTVAAGDGSIYLILDGYTEETRKQAINETRQYIKKMPEAERKRIEAELNERDTRILVALDAKTGDVHWTRGIDVSDCGGASRNYQGIRKRKYPPAMIYRNGVLLHFNASAGGKYWGHWVNGDWAWRAVAARSAEDGSLIWFTPVNFKSRLVVVDDTVYAEPWALDLKTGKFRTRKHPITGAESRWTWCRFGKHCGIFAASKYFLFGRSAGVGYHDLLNDRGLYTFMHSRSSCWFDTVSGGGVMIKPPQSHGCSCQVAAPFTIAMGQVTVPPAAPQIYSAWGPLTPVKHLNIDFGATGDRHDSSGNLWLASKVHRPARLPVIRFQVLETLYSGGGNIARSSLFTPIENTDVPFVFASAVRGLKKCVVPLLSEGQGKAVFDVRLGFAAPPGDKVGQRVFDVKVEGKTVLKDFDIVKEAGGVDRAVWKELAGITSTKDLSIELIAKAQKPAPEQMPLLNAAQIVRRDAAEPDHAGSR
ncbi:MAG: malectin domain-containing carbohydrate-binding protein, partial [Planctomycetota bacterium]